ncbi:MAG TPA: hypothetical protein VMS21_07070 [Methylomirabilota bacterium]|nr:hypothetical protein [Methylomirabilota bacterium]
MESENWTELSDEQLMERKISRLGLKLAGTDLESWIQQLYDELSARGLSFHPPCHVGDEWFCPVGIPAVFVPFYLTHERLKRIERRIILEVEGETKPWFMRLMRHEAGHAYSYAYQLYRKKRWQQQFGLASTEESDTYRPRPYSRGFVLHLDNWYAQSHPDEDFAETFAVWLTPGLDWRERYRGWKALQKLEYVDELMRSIAGKPPVHLPAYNPREYDCLNIKLKTFYARKRKLYEESHPDFYDRDLRRLFPGTPGEKGGEKASQYLRRSRRLIMDSVCQWTKERKYRVNQLLNRLIQRCDELELRVAGHDPALSSQVASYITCLVMNYLFTGKFKRSK